MIRTVAFHALVYQPVEERATVVTERRAGVCVNLKLVFAARILQPERKVNLNDAVFYLEGDILDHFSRITASTLAWQYWKVSTTLWFYRRHTYNKTVKVPIFSCEICKDTTDDKKTTEKVISAWLSGTCLEAVICKNPPEAKIIKIITVMHNHATSWPRKNSPRPGLHTKAKEKVHQKSPISGGLIKPGGCSKAGNNKAASMMSYY